MQMQRLYYPAAIFPRDAKPTFTFLFVILTRIYYQCKLIAQSERPWYHAKQGCLGTFVTLFDFSTSPSQIIALGLILMRIVAFSLNKSAEKVRKP